MISMVPVFLNIFSDTQMQSIAQQNTCPTASQEQLALTLFQAYGDSGQQPGTRAQQCAQSSQPPDLALEARYICLGDHMEVQS